MRIPTFLLCPLLILVLAGCNSFERRASEKSSVFTTLDSATQERLKNRDLRLDDTQDMVYIALGVPDERRDRLSADGSSTTWIYNAYWQEYQGQQLVGYRRHVVYDEANKRYQVHSVPVQRSVHDLLQEERIRVTFRNGRVVTIEQAELP